MSDDVTPFVPDGRLVFEATDAMTGKRTRLETVAPVTEYALGYEPIVEQGREIGDPARMWINEPDRIVGAKLTIEATVRKLDSAPSDVLYRAVETSGEHAHAHLVVSAADLKMLRETLCSAQSGDTLLSPEAARLDALIAEIDRHRPLGTDGTHGNLHTSTCGCEDR